MINNVIKHKFKLWKPTPTAMKLEDTPNLGLGAPSICIEYHWLWHSCLATAPSSCLEDPAIRHRTITRNLLTKQVAHIHGLMKEFLATREGTKLHIRQQLSYYMRLRQLMSIHSGKFQLMKRRESMYLEETSHT